MSPFAPLLVVLFVLYFVAGPAYTFMHLEHRHRLGWRRLRRVSVPEPPGGAPFRDGEPGAADRARDYTVEECGAPPLVKVVAVTSLILGHMLVPGMFAGLIGLAFGGAGIVAIPGLVLAARIYRNASGLLAGDPVAANKSYEIRDFAVALNIVVLGVVACLIPSVGWHPWLLFTAGYAVISLVHAAGLGRAAKAIHTAHTATFAAATAPGSQTWRPAA